MVDGLVYFDEQREEYSKRFVGDLMVRPEITSSVELRETLRNIGRSAYDTTFIDDYDRQEDGLKLSTLREFPAGVRATCLKHLFEKGNEQVKRYVIEEVGSERLGPMRYFLDDIVARLGDSVFSFGYDAKKALTAFA